MAGQLHRYSCKVGPKMIEYTIRFELHPDKVSEFTQSWKCFCEHTKDAEGLVDCQISKVGDNCHQILMTWTERYYLYLFMKDDWYTFLQGAVNVLGDNSVITQKDVSSSK